MAHDKNRDEFDAEIKADPNYAQILIKCTDLPASQQEAEKIITSLGVHILSTAVLSNDWVLFKLDVKDMRGIALKLTETGFNVTGINALSD